MRFIRLVLRNLFRNRVRFAITVVLIAAVFFFVASLLSALASIERMTEAGDRGNRLGVQSAISLAEMLPYAHEERLRRIPGVTEVAKLQWLAAHYKDRGNPVATYALDADKVATVWDDYSAAPSELQAFLEDRQGAIIGPKLAEQFGWKVGDRIHLDCSGFGVRPELNIRAIYAHDINTTSLYFHLDYFQELIGNPGKVATFWLKVENPDQLRTIGQQIDAMFRNSEYPTESFTEKEFRLQFLSMMGNIRLLFGAVSTAAIFVLVLLTALTMSVAARERVNEVAVLKAIGFSPHLLLSLMITEFILLAVIGAGIGAVGGALVYRMVNMTEVTNGALVNFYIGGKTIALCLASAVLVAMISGGIPAIRCSRTITAEALRRVV